MTWRDELRRVTVGGRQMIGASFRGVGFLVESSEYVGGRRAVVHEFPLRNKPFVEDLGERAHSFRVEGYVIGDDYLAQRDALTEALEGTSGPGELVHPYHGVRRAICVNLSVRSTRTEGGMATFAIDFAETPTQAPVPVEVVDAAEQVADSADEAITATDAELQESYDVTGLPSFAIASAETALTSAATALESTLAPAITDTQELAEMTGRVAVLTAQAASLVRQPAEVLTEFRAIITGLIETAASAPGAVVDALVESYTADLGPVAIETTATRTREIANQTALTGALRRVMSIEASRLAPLVPYTSLEDAMATRDTIAAQLEEQAATAGDTAYPALVNLRSELLRAVPGEATFARVTTVTRPVPIPSLLLAYQLYGSVDLEADIIERNAIEHPGFIAGEIKVLSEAT